jgi:hypothetical protein
MFGAKMNSRFDVIIYLKVCLILISFVTSNLLCSEGEVYGNKTIKFTISNNAKDPQKVALAFLWPKFCIVGEEIVQPGEKMQVSTKGDCRYLVVRSLFLNQQNNNIRDLKYLNRHFKIIMVPTDLTINDTKITSQDDTKEHWLNPGSLLQTLPDYNQECKIALGNTPKEFKSFMSIE